MHITPVNENNIMVIFAKKADALVTQHIAQFNDELKEFFGKQIIDTIPSYISLLICFNNAQTDLNEFTKQLQQFIKNFSPSSLSRDQGNYIEIPVYYGQDVALDANEICTHTGLDFEEVIKYHSNQSYTVYAIGFSIGFAYLGQTHPKITIPRKQTPRTSIPAKSVALADNQTAIYPQSSPGGWQIIGRTPIKLTNFNRPELTIFNVGDEVRFIPISQQEFILMGGVL